MGCVYKKNKNYIPLNYYYKRKNENDRINEILFKLMCFVNIILMPLSAEHIKIENHNEEEKNVMAEQSFKEEKNNYKNMSAYLKLLSESSINEVEINNKTAYIKVNDLNEFYNSSLKNDFKVINAVKDDDGMCTLKVCINE